MVERNVDRIRGTVQNILYYAKERELQREAVAPEQLAEEACNLVQPRADEHGIELQRAFERGRSLFADPRALCSMLVNLLENSVDACRVDKKKDAHRVRLALEGRGRGVAFVVEDNGIGMDRETQARAFSLFFSSKGAEGTGLGLFIAEKIAKSHGGSIRLDSAPDRGTRFTVTIPGHEPKGGSEP